MMMMMMISSWKQQQQQQHDVQHPKQKTEERLKSSREEVANVFAKLFAAIHMEHLLPSLQCSKQQQQKRILAIGFSFLQGATLIDPSP
jgi:hypothetical protein